MLMFIKSLSIVAIWFGVHGTYWTMITCHIDDLFNHGNRVHMYSSISILDMGVHILFVSFLIGCLIHEFGKGYAEMDSK